LQFQIEGEPGCVYPSDAKLLYSRETARRDTIVKKEEDGNAK
jgi:hypothetical protein